MSKQNYRRIRLWLIIIVIVLSGGLVSCSGSSARVEEIGMDAARTPIAVEDIGSTGNGEGYTTAEENSMPMPKEVVVKEGIVATDPGSVALVSGKVQLIEFFAFW